MLFGLLLPSSRSSVRAVQSRFQEMVMSRIAFQNVRRKSSGWRRDSQERRDRSTGGDRSGSRQLRAMSNLLVLVEPGGDKPPGQARQTYLASSSGRGVLRVGSFSGFSLAARLATFLCARRSALARCFSNRFISFWRFWKVMLIDPPLADRIMKRTVAANAASRSYQRGSLGWRAAPR
jgi:hypothetical protein